MFGIRSLCSFFRHWLAQTCKCQAPISFHHKTNQNQRLTTPNRNACSHAASLAVGWPKMACPKGPSRTVPKNCYFPHFVVLRPAEGISRAWQKRFESNKPCLVVQIVFRSKQTLVFWNKSFFRLKPLPLSRFFAYF